VIAEDGLSLSMSFYDSSGRGPVLFTLSRACE